MAPRKNMRKQPKQAVSYLMKIPPELRLRIFGFYFQEKLCIVQIVRRRTSCKAICAWRNDQSPNTSSAALLRVCRTFYTEAYGVMMASTNVCVLLQEDIVTRMDSQSHLTTPRKGIDVAFLSYVRSIRVCLEITGYPTQLMALETLFETIAYGESVKEMVITLIGREALVDVNVEKGMDDYQRLMALLNRLLCKGKVNLMSVSLMIAILMSATQRVKLMETVFGDDIPWASRTSAVRQGWTLDCTQKFDWAGVQRPLVKDGKLEEFLLDIADDRSLARS